MNEQRRQEIEEEERYRAEVRAELEGPRRNLAPLWFRWLLGILIALVLITALAPDAEFYDSLPVIGADE